MRFAIMGAGALGSILGAHLVRAGHDVVLLARGERAAALERDGLAVRGLATIDVRPRVLRDPAALRETDALVVATKAIGSAESLAALARPDVGCAFSVQNGVLKDALLGEAFGAERVLGCMADFSGELLPDGVVRFTRNVCLYLGALAPDTSERATVVSALIDAAGVRSVVAADIRVRQWSKFVGWIAQFPLAALTRRFTWEFLTDEAGATVIVRIAREAKALADAEGIPIQDASPLPVASIARATDEEALALVHRVGEKYRAGAPEHRVSVQQDALRGSPLEIEETLGFALRRAAALGIAMPTLDACYRLSLAAHPASRRQA